MNIIIKVLALVVLMPFFSFQLNAQDATVSGTVMSTDGYILPNVTIDISGIPDGNTTDSLGRFSVTVPSGKKVNFKFSYLGFEVEYISVNLKAGEVKRYNIEMKALVNINNEDAIITDQSFRNETGTIKIDQSKVPMNPSTIGGIEALLKIILGDHNELSSQYKVRGGNFDENLVYVNDFEIYRPFLVRSGQQEGLSFVNADLAEDVTFSVGGFQSRYGDKLSSVLDVAYKRPEKFGGSAMGSLLGAQLHLEGATKNKKLTYLFGARQKSNQYLLQAQPTEGQYNPSFTDIQGLINYRFNARWELEAIGNYARNRFSFIPNKSEESFGFFNNVFRLYTNFSGSEDDRFDTRFGGISLKYKPSAQSWVKLLVSAFQTNEKETYDIKGRYDLMAIESDIGKSSFNENKFSLGSGMIHDHARNYLTANVISVALKGVYLSNRHGLAWGLDATSVSVDDKMLEWQRRDSAGFSQPFDSHNIYMARHTFANNQLDYARFAAYIQDNILLGAEKNMTLNIGTRITYTPLNNEVIVSPRLQYAYTPEWENHNIIFRLSSGMYAQPIFYRELRDMNGALHPDLKAQKSLHFAGGFDWNLKMWDNRPFKLTAEVFYKQLWDLIPYEYDNVRIRYFANNNARGYAYGGEVRLFGNLVKDAESWLSMGYLKTENQIYDETTNTWSHFIPRPTDQRFTFGAFFSDYLPRNKNFKVFVNIMYATGLPFSPPGKSLNPNFQLRIPDYKRVDIGFSALLLDGTKKDRPAYSMFNAFESIWASFEVFNLLGIQNTLSYQWIQDFSSDRIYAVPNRLTSRLLNLKLAVRF